MTTAQKIIKYCAIAFAISLMVGIISGFVMMFNIIGNILYDDAIVYDNSVSINSNTKVLNIDLNISNLTIKKGDKLNIISNNKYIKVDKNDGIVNIKEKNHLGFNYKDNKVTITIPTNIKLDNVNLNAGAGKITIDYLNTSKINFSLGAGKVTIKELNVDKETFIDGGAGKIEILSGNINNLNFDMGIGNTIIKSNITGNSDIDCGIGALELNLLNNMKNYTFEIEKGLGSVTLNKENVKEGKIGSGINLIEIDGGVGSININTQEK